MPRRRWPVLILTGVRVVAPFVRLAWRTRRRRLDGLSGNVISLYAKGLTVGEIQAHLEEIYDTSVSRETISEITEGFVSDMAAWQNRTARSGLCGAGFNAIVVKALDSQVRQQARVCRYRRGSCRRT